MRADREFLRRCAGRQVRDQHRHAYDGGCPWCRADDAEFLGGGAHEHATALFAALDDAVRQGVGYCARIATLERLVRLGYNAIRATDVDRLTLPPDDAAELRRCLGQTEGEG